MSWDEDYRRRYPCPCGQGEYEVTGRSNDWGQSETIYSMLCPVCSERYIYDGTMVGGHPGDEHFRGWVAKTVIAAEQRYRALVTERMHHLYYQCWRAQLDAAQTKKQLWEIVTVDGRHYPALGTFYQHHKGHTLDEAKAATERDFHFQNLRQILDVCQITPDWAALGVQLGSTCELCGGQMTTSLSGLMCGQCMYIRPAIR